MFDACDVEEMVFVVIGEVPFHLERIHPAVGLRDVDGWDAEGRKNVTGNTLSGDPSSKEQGAYSDEHGPRPTQGRPHHSRSRHHREICREKLKLRMKKVVRLRHYDSMSRLSIFLAVLCVTSVSALQAAPKTIPQPEIYFSPDGGCTEAIVAEIEKAKTSILVQAYSFTSAPIAEALVKASRRGVNVVAILDKSNKTAKYSAADFLLHAKIATFIDPKHAIAHNKIMILDGAVVITGSFNFTKSAEENNAENLIIMRSNVVADRYIENFNAHKAHAEPYEGK